MLIALLFTSMSFSQIVIDKDLYSENKTFTHQELILKYIKLQKEHPKTCKLINYGETDCGKPLHLFVINNLGIFDPSKIARNQQNVLLINNAIHPGEPCGVDASVKVAREWLREKSLPNMVVAIIPMYNIGGAQNRSCCSRANQNGPLEYGFRGNARNLDLNRDFIKMDSDNAKTFVKIFRDWDPDVFLDTHTSNGADYQHTMSLITTQINKLNPKLRSLVKNKFNTPLFSQMLEVGYPMVPYMHMMGKTPKEGIFDYLETPRYSTGYAAQFDCIGFVSEAHMLKPYKDRVLSTYQLIVKLTNITSNLGIELYNTRNIAKQHTAHSNLLPHNYSLDTTKFQQINFMGYAAKYKPSLISGQDRLYYDRQAPYTTRIKYYNTYQAKDTIRKPEYYIIPQSWREVIERFKLNKVSMISLKQDSSILVSVDYIDSFETVSKPYEGHYLHYNTTLTSKEMIVNFSRGDWLVKTGEFTDRFVMETLESSHRDSYFNWNFFDEILMQKEWFSSYVFEDKAVEILAEDPELRSLFEQKKSEDLNFAKNANQQLYFIYKHSQFYEKTHMRVPIFKIF